jgi:hypothetical protein
MFLQVKTNSAYEFIREGFTGKGERIDGTSSSKAPGLLRGCIAGGLQNQSMATIVGRFDNARELDKAVERLARAGLKTLFTMRQLWRGILGVLNGGLKEGIAQDLMRWVCTLRGLIQRSRVMFNHGGHTKLRRLAGRIGSAALAFDACSLRHSLTTPPTNSDSAL